MSELIVKFRHDERGIARSWEETGKIIRCKDCKYYAPEAGDDSYALGYCPFIGSHLVMSKGFCAWGERRGDSK